ncbi:MAG: hypothetical protein HY053_02035 [Proteobacteria bacterium]|nr:hypothetical protein [Pseudomonadota bacterium]
MAKHSNNIGVSIVAGVNPGYEGGRFAIHEPASAAEHVRKIAGELGIEGEIFPGLCLYQKDRGCPAGGEPAGILFTIAFADALNAFDALRRRLGQEFMSVITPPSHGVPTRGVIIDFGEGDLKDIALRWQEAAAGMLPKLGFHLSGAVFEAGGKICGQAEANPARIKDLKAWTKASRGLIQVIKPGVRPVFRRVGYHTLRDG